MLCPIRCFSCGQVIADKIDEYNRLVKEEKKLPKDALDLLGFHKYCCRRMILSNVDTIDEIMNYSLSLKQKK
ncbi:MAG: DNA-directed RNA polymerase subunit N [archaeon]